MPNLSKKHLIARRTFIGALASFAGFFYLIPPHVSKSITAGNIFNCNFKLIFPYKMNREQQIEAKKSFENKEIFSALLEKFKSEGRILSESVSFHDTFSSWDVVFKSKIDFYSWVELTGKLGSHSLAQRNIAGFKLEVNGKPSYF